MMNVRWIAAMGGLLLAACSGPALAQRQSTPAPGPAQPDLSRFPTLSLRVGRGSGLDPALLLTPDQKERIAAARRETIDSEPVAAALKVASVRGAVTPEVEAAQVKVGEAYAHFQEKVATVLTPEQKTLIALIGAAAADLQKSVGEEFAPRLAALSREDVELASRLYREAREKLETEFAKKLDGILTPAQKAAMAQAAAEEKAAAEKARANRRQ